IKKEVIKQDIIDETLYYYEGELLICEKSKNKLKKYLYDENNMLYGIINNGYTYYYVRDILGNILGLVDINGSYVIKYTYNAFGKVLEVEGLLQETLGKDNPFIYKGYYYDNETELYLLTTRYYNPEW